MGARESGVAYVLLATEVELRLPGGETTVENVLRAEVASRTFPLCVSAHACDLIARYVEARDSGRYVSVQIMAAEMLGSDGSETGREWWVRSVPAQGGGGALREECKK